MTRLRLAAFALAVLALVVTFAAVAGATSLSTVSPGSLPSCLMIYGVRNPTIIEAQGTPMTNSSILAYAEAHNPGLAWKSAGGSWVGNPGAVNYPVNADIFEYNGQLYDLTMFLDGGCTTIITNSSGVTTCVYSCGVATSASSESTSTVEPTVATTPVMSNSASVMSSSTGPTVIGHCGSACSTGAQRGVDADLLLVGLVLFAASGGLYVLAMEEGGRGG